MNLHNIFRVGTAEQYLQAISDGYEDIRAKKKIRLETIDLLLKKEEKSASELLELGLLLLNNGAENRFELAKGLADRLIEIDPMRGNYLMGWMLSRPNSPYASEDKLFACIKSSADKGYVPAINSLGYLYGFRQDVEGNDQKEAVRLFQIAALEGRATAQFNLALCFKEGIGVPQSLEQTIFYYRLAADQGDPKAMNNLGNCYYNGDGVDRSLLIAVGLWKQAAEWEAPKACRSLGECYRDGDWVEQSYEEAARYFEMGAELDDVGCVTYLADLYFKGLGVKKDLDKAIALYEKAESLGFPDAELWIEKIKAQQEGK